MNNIEITLMHDGKIAFTVQDFPKLLQHVYELGFNEGKTKELPSICAGFDLANLILLASEEALIKTRMLDDRN